MAKSAVSALQEFCAQKKILFPEYTWIDAEDGGFICKIEIDTYTANEHGRSKRDAKHLAAAKILKMLRTSYPELPAVSIKETLPHDMIVTIRDYCVQNNHPLPRIDILQKSGSDDAPEFIAVCSVASIVRYGYSDHKKQAKQIAANALLKAIYEEKAIDNEMQCAVVDKTYEDVESVRYDKMRTYRELTKALDTNINTGILLCDRHNYYANFHDNIKDEAKCVLESEYESREKQVFELFKALKITPKISEVIKTNSDIPNLFIELNCTFDTVFVGTKDDIYNKILNYFKVMLYD